MNLAGVSVVEDGAAVGVAVVGGVVEGSVLVLPGGQTWLMHLNLQRQNKKKYRNEEKHAENEKESLGELKGLGQVHD